MRGGARKAGQDAAIPYVPLALIGLVAVSVVSLAFVATFVGLWVPRREPAVSVDGPGTSLIATNGNAQTGLYPLSGLRGIDINIVDNTAQIGQTGFKSDLARLQVIASTNLYSYSFGDAEYRYDLLHSDAGTLMYHANYHLYFAMAANATGMTTVVFSMPDEMLSQATADGAAILNNYGVFNADCNGINNADGTPLPAAAFVLTQEVVYIGYPGPTMFLRVNPSLYGASGMGVECSFDIIAPVAQ